MATVATLSEAELLAAFVPLLKEHQLKAAKKFPDQPLVVGPGDDAAVLDLRGGLTVMSTDTQTENQDFRRLWPSGRTSSGFDVGWKAGTQNLADVAAMGARPVTLLVSLTLTEDTGVSWVQDFARGLLACLEAHQVHQCSISGGDLGLGSELSITVTSVGVTSSPVTRSGAQVSDAVVLAGAVGTAAAGFALLETPGLPPLSPALERCVQAQQRPCAPLAAGVQDAGVLHAMMDVSDGLLRDSERLAAASQVGIALESALLAPWVQAVQGAADLLAPENPDAQALRWVLTGGEDHGLLATCSPDQIPQGFTRIGTVVEGDTVTVDGQSMSAKGWDHFETGTR